MIFCKRRAEQTNLFQNLIYAPVSEGSPLSEYSQNNHYSQQPHKNVTKLAGDQIHGQTRVNDNLETDNNVIYRIPEDYIDTNNYMKHNNILHTELYGDRGKEMPPSMWDLILNSVEFLQVLQPAWMKSLLGPQENITSCSFKLAIAAINIIVELK